MSQFAIVRYGRSVRIEMLIVASVVVILFCLPVAALAAITNLGSVAQGGELYNGPTDTRVTYIYGNCTYWAALKRIEAGQPIPNTWGNANTWSQRAQADGYRIDHIPEVGAIMQTAQGQFGHVAIVTAISPNFDSWTISEMNFVGFDIVSQRTLPIGLSLTYNFIHSRTP